jgi:hypothetical protein
MSGISLSINGTIQLEKSWYLETQRTNDLFLMDTIMNHLPHFPPKTLKHLNACRIFLQVITLADITDGSGCGILKCSLIGVQHSDQRSSYKWPKQIRQSSEAWRLWQHIFTTLFSKCPKSTKLRQSLGAWQSAGPIHQQWTYFINPATNCLLQCSEASGIYQSFCQAHSLHLFHSTADVTFSCPPRLLPVSVARQTQHYIEITACPMHSHIYIKLDKVIPPQVKAQSMIQHIQQLPAVLQNALGHCYFPPNMSNLVTEFNNQTLVIASDGSMAHNTATQAWILYGTQTNTQAYGHGPVPGGGQPLTSLQAEIGGYVCGTLALDAILSTTRVPAPQHHCSIVGFIDNKALISHINNWQHQGLAGTLALEYDLLQVAQGVMAKIKSQ